MTQAQPLPKTQISQNHPTNHHQHSYTTIDPQNPATTKPNQIATKPTLLIFKPPNPLPQTNYHHCHRHHHSTTKPQPPSLQPKAQPKNKQPTGKKKNQPINRNNGTIETIHNHQHPKTYTHCHPHPPPPWPHRPTNPTTNIATQRIPRRHNKNPLSRNLRRHTEKSTLSYLATTPALGRGRRLGRRK